MTFTDKLKPHIPHGSRILCALSGGADSTAMTAALSYLRAELELRLAAAHYHPGLRGEDADRDQLFCEQLCERLGIRLVHERRAVNDGGGKSRGVEADIRRDRYNFLSRAARDCGMDYIATAHNADDNAETMLLNLIRGTGPDGLAGIPPRRDNIIRPMLSCTHDEALAYLSELGLEHREDMSNHTDAYRRNRLRRNVIPLLRAENPSLSETLGRTAALMRQDAEYLNQLARETLDRLETEARELTRLPPALEAVRPRETGVFVCAEQLNALPPSLSGRVIRLMAEKALGLCGMDIARTHIDAALSLCGKSGEKAASGRIKLPRGLTAERQYDMLKIYTGDDGAEDFEPVRLDLGGRAVLAGQGLAVTWQKKPEKVHNLVYSFGLTSDTIERDLQIRPRESGDRISLAGRGGSKSLQDLFVDAKIPRALRARIPVVCDGGGVVGVYGFGADARAASGSEPSVICFYLLE